MSNWNASGAGAPSFRVVGANGWLTIKDHVPNNFGVVTSTPVPGQVPLSARMSTIVDFATLSAGADWVVVDLTAVATSGAPPASNTPARPTS